MLSWVLPASLAISLVVSLDNRASRLLRPEVMRAIVKRDLQVPCSVGLSLSPQKNSMSHMGNTLWPGSLNENTWNRHPVTSQPVEEMLGCLQPIDDM